MTASYARSFFGASDRRAVATARAGNVIGGGDWSEDRLVPDIVRALASGERARLRYPNSVRPWQHVIEPLAGYLQMAEAMHGGNAASEEALNFAPAPENFRTVAELTDALLARFAGGPGWSLEPGTHPPEAELLTLSAERARSKLGWRSLLSFEETVALTADWYSAYFKRENMLEKTITQIESYEGLLADRRGAVATTVAAAPFVS